MKISRIISVSLVAMMVWSCSQTAEKAEMPEETDPRIDQTMVRTAQDTLELTSLVDKYLTSIQQGEYDAAVAMISVYNDSTNTLEPPVDSIVGMLKAQYQNFPVLSYTIDEINLYSETDTEVRYTVTMFECAEGEDLPNTMRFMLLPKRVNGLWTLCVGGRSIMR